MGADQQDDDDGRKDPPRLSTAAGGESIGGTVEVDVDLDSQGPPPSGAPQTVEFKPYDPAPHRDRMRGRIAMTLVGTLTGTIAGALLTVAFAPDRMQGVLDILGVVLGPLVALVGAATGYYFGAATQETASSGKAPQ